MDDLALWLLDQIDADEQRARAARESPARVLAECEARREIVVRCGSHVHERDDWDNGLPSPRALLARQTLKLLARPYHDRPGYRD